MRRFGLMVAALLILSAAWAGSAGEPVEAFTIGQFIQHLARVTHNLDTTDSLVAAESLAARGIRLPDDIDQDAVLTDGASR